MEETNAYAILPYGYSVLDYCRLYDPTWQQWLRDLEAIYTKHIVLPRLKQRQNDYSTRLYATRFSKESIYVTLSYLDCFDLLVAAQVNREWNELACHNRLWDRLLVKNFAFETSSIRLLNSKRIDSSKTTENVKRLGDSNGEISSKTVYLKMEKSFRDVAFRQSGFKTQPVIPASFLM